MQHQASTQDEIPRIAERGSKVMRLVFNLDDPQNFIDHYRREIYMSLT